MNENSQKNGWGVSEVSRNCSQIIPLKKTKNIESYEIKDFHWPEIKANITDRWILCDR